MSNEEVAKVANQGSDIMIPFASIDPAKGKMGAREARRLIKDYGVKGFKFRPQIQEFYPNDRNAYVLYEAIAGAGLPALFHTGRSGMGSGMRGGAASGSSTATPCTSTTSQSTFPTCRSSSRIRRGRGGTKRCRFACTSRRYISTCLDGRPSTSHRS